MYFRWKEEGKKNQASLLNVNMIDIDSRYSENEVEIYYYCELNSFELDEICES